MGFSATPLIRERGRSRRRPPGSTRAAVAVAVAVVALLACAALLPGGAAAAAPDPGGNEYSPILGPGPNQVFGFSGIGQVGSLAPATAARYVADARGNMTRTPMHWQALEPTRDNYREPAFEKYDQLYEALRARDIEPIFVLQYAPAWAREPGPAQTCGTFDACHYPPAPAMLGEWRQFVAYVSQRYPKAAIEVWNEPNYRGQWMPAPDPARYAELLAAADEAIAKVNPGARVFAGGLGSVWKQGWIGPAAFLTRAYAANPSLESHTDAVNIHLYPSLQLGAGSPFAAVFGAVRNARDAAGDGGTPLLVSELGVTTTGPGAMSEVQQGDLLLRATRKILTMDDTLGVLVYTLADRTELAAEDPERGFGVVRPNAGPLGTGIEPKLAYCALRRAAALGFIDCPPETTISAAPPAISASGDVVEFRFGSPDLTTTGYQCSLDDATFSSCTSPASYRNLAPGRHSFSARARDLLGRYDPFPARTEFVIDAGGHALQVKSRKRAWLEPGGKRKPFTVTVTAPGAPVPIEAVRICVRGASKQVRAPKRSCRELGTLEPGSRLQSRFRIGLKKHAGKRRLRVKLKAKARGKDTEADTARVRLIARG